MSSPYLKLFMLLIMAVVSERASTAPNNATSADQIDNSTFMNKYMRFFRMLIFLPVTWAPNVVLSTILLLRIIPSTSDMFSNICPREADSELGRISVSFLGAFFLTSSGSCIRWACFRTLGRFFTFEVTVRPNHKLIDTGLYAFVRHPSYLGAILMCFGTIVLTLSPQSPATACGWIASSLLIKLVIAFVWVFIPAFVAYSVTRRVPSEEENLRSHFGREWDEYAKRVPYRYVPGVL